MGFLDRLKNAFTAFNRINDNPFYQTYQITGSGFRFSDFNQEYVIDKGYANNADLYAIVKKIASTAASVPLVLYDNSREESELVESGELYDLIQQPNRFQSREEFIEEALLFLLLSGNSYTVGHKALGFGDKFQELNNLPSQYVTIEGGGMVQPIRKYWYQEVNNMPFDPENVMHVKYANPKGEGVERLYGLSPLQAGNNALQSSNNTYDARGNIIKNHGVSGILTSNSERSLTKEQGESLQYAWDAKNNNPKKFGRTLVTSAQMQFLQMGMSPTDLQLIESGVIDLRTLCNIYSVPSQLFNDVAGTTFNNMEAAKKSLYTEAVLPNLNLLVKKLNGWFIDSWNKSENKNYCLEINTSGVEVLQQDQREEAEKDRVITQTVMEVLESDISLESKVQTLIYTIGMTEQQARLLVTEEVNETEL